MTRGRGFRRAAGMASCVLLTALATAACGVPSSEVAKPIPRAQLPDDLVRPRTTAKVYFAVEGDTRVSAVSREVAIDSDARSRAATSINLLLRGPTSLEDQQGYTTALVPGLTLTAARVDSNSKQLWVEVGWNPTAASTTAPSNGAPSSGTPSSGTPSSGAPSSGGASTASLSAAAAESASAAASRTSSTGITTTTVLDTGPVDDLVDSGARTPGPDAPGADNPLALNPVATAQVVATVTSVGGIGQVQFVARGRVLPVSIDGFQLTDRPVRRDDFSTMLKQDVLYQVYFPRNGVVRPVQRVVSSSDDPREVAKALLRQLGRGPSKRQTQQGFGNIAGICPVKVAERVVAPRSDEMYLELCETYNDLDPLDKALLVAQVIATLEQLPATTQLKFVVGDTPTLIRLRDGAGVLVDQPVSPRDYRQLILDPRLAGSDPSSTVPGVSQPADTDASRTGGGATGGTDPDATGADGTGSAGTGSGGSGSNAPATVGSATAASTSPAVEATTLPATASAGSAAPGAGAALPNGSLNT